MIDIQDVKPDNRVNDYVRDVYFKKIDIEDVPDAFKKDVESMLENIKPFEIRRPQTGPS